MTPEPNLTTATLIHHVVGDLLCQNKFVHTECPEIVDLAVISTGLGILQSRFRFVQQGSRIWDSTYWTEAPRPFLDTEALAYASAIAAWVRGDDDPQWISELPNEVKRPMRKSLKYLIKTNDSFFHPSTAARPLLKQKQSDWLQLASDASISTQIVALRHLEPDELHCDRQENRLLETLRSPSQPVVLNSIAAVESLNFQREQIANELRLLVENQDDEIRSKAMIALTRSNQLDELTIGCAAKMVDNSVNYVAFAGVFALASLESAPENVLRVAERGFIRALQSCNYEFVGLFAAAFNRWLSDPVSHFERLLQDDQPEYLEIAVEALQNVREQSVTVS
jgi:hypothetical protein